MAPRVVAAAQPDRAVSAAVPAQDLTARTPRAKRTTSTDGRRHARTPCSSNNRLNTRARQLHAEDVSFANPGFNGNGQDQAALKPTLVYPDLRGSAELGRAGARRQRVPVRRHVVVVHARHDGEHDVKIRRAVRVRERRSTAQDNLNGTFFFRTDAPFNAADPRTYPERLHDSRPGRARHTQKAHFVIGVRAGQVEGRRRARR